MIETVYQKARKTVVPIKTYEDKYRLTHEKLKRSNKYYLLHIIRYIRKRFSNIWSAFVDVVSNRKDWQYIDVTKYNYEKG